MSDITGELHHRYGLFSDEELLVLAAQRENLTPEAQILLDQELSSRKLSIRDIAQMDEPESEAPKEPYFDIEPQELPPDFFTEEVPVQATSVASRRPAGINLIAFVCWFNAVWSIWIAVVVGIETYVPSALSVVISAALNLVVGIVELIVGIGLFRMRRWSLRAGILVFMLNGSLAGVILILAAIEVFRGGQADPLRSFWMFVTVIYSGIIVNYLLALAKQGSDIWS